MASDRTKNKVFIADRLTERTLHNSYDAVLTNLIPADSQEARQVLVDARTRVVFMLANNYISHLQVTLTLPEKLDPDVNTVAVVRFNADCCLECQLDSISNTTYKAVAPEDEKVRENDHCYQLSIRYDDKQVADHIAPEFSELKVYLRTKNHIAIFIRGTEEVTSDFSQLMDQLRLDRRRNPLLKWYPATKRPNMQKGQELKPQDRPQIEAIEPVYALHSFFDYMTRYGYGTHYNQEHVDNLLDPFAESIHKMRFFEIPGGEDRRVFFFLEMPAYEEVRLLPGDKLQVFLDEEQDATKVWNATITEPLPFSPINQVTGWITRPWNKETRDYNDKRDLKAIPWRRLNNVSRANYLIMKQPPHEVSIRVITSDKPYSRSIAALEALNKIYSGTQSTQRQRDNLMFLLGNHMDLVAKVDMYHGIRPKIPQPFKVMSLNAGQLRTVMMTDELPGGYLLVHGPPGTGKTYLIGEMLKPFFMDSDRHQILLTSANNAGVDSTAARAHQVLADLQAQGIAPKEKYIIRLHSLETEKSITVNNVKVGREMPADARPKCVQAFDEDDMDLLNRMDMAKIIDNAYKQSVAQKFEGIHDKRVTELELSLGHRMLQVAGIIGDAPFALPPDDRLRRKFAVAYRQYENGDVMDKERSKLFRAQTQLLLSHTIANADAIATTLDIAQVPQVADNYSTAEGLFADEAARVLDSNLWGILEKYPHLTFKILVGDCYQLPPVVQSSKKTNPFYSQISLSVMARLQAIGALCAFLEEQMRGLPEMVEPYNVVTYRGRLIHAPSTKLSSRPIAQAVREFNTTNYGRESNVIYFDLRDVNSETLASGSTHNEGSCAFAMTIIESLILAGVPGSKVILTPYQGQYRILMSALQVMAKTHPEAKEVDVDKIDRRQGSEWDICVIDITRTSGAGFLFLLGRLNTLFSRGKNGLYIIGKKSHIDKLPKSQGRWLQKFQSEYLRFRTVVDGKPTSPYYQPGQVDLNNAYDEEELEGQEDESEDGVGLAKGERAPSKIHKLEPAYREALLTYLEQDARWTSVSPFPYTIDEIDHELRPRRMETYYNPPTFGDDDLEDIRGLQGSMTADEVHAWLASNPSLFELHGNLTLFNRCANHYDAESLEARHFLELPRQQQSDGNNGGWEDAAGDQGNSGDGWDLPAW